MTNFERDNDTIFHGLTMQATMARENALMLQKLVDDWFVNDPQHNATEKCLTLEDGTKITPQMAMQAIKDYTNECIKLMRQAKAWHEAMG